MNSTIKFLTLGLSAILLYLALDKLKRRRPGAKKIKYPLDISELDASEIELLKLEDVILWFKENVPEELGSVEAVLLQITNENQIKGKSIFDFENSDKRLFLQGYYKTDSRQFSKSRFISTLKIDDDLNDQMGNENLLVFE